MTFDRIYTIVRHIPKGKVLTYKSVAEFAGIRNYQIVGYALHANHNPSIIPCHRVVKRSGTLSSGYAFGGKSEQRKKLKNENISFRDYDTVDLGASFWKVPFYLKLYFILSSALDITLLF